MDGSQGAFDESPLEPAAVRRFLADNPEFLREDTGLLDELGLRIAGNVVDFQPAAIARVHAAHQRESAQRLQLEETARANFAAQAQAHGAVIDLLDARNHSDLAARLDELSRHRFGLSAGVVAIEAENAPMGWKRLVEGQVDMLMGGSHRMAAMGFFPVALGLFPDAIEVGSMALVRTAMWEPSHQGLLAFASAESDGFTPDMGSELVAFLARVMERTSERWPLL